MTITQRLDIWKNKVQTSTHERQQFNELAKIIQFLEEKKGYPKIRVVIDTQCKARDTVFIGIPVGMGTQMRINCPTVLLTYLVENYRILSKRHPEMRAMWANSRALRKEVITYCMHLRLHRQNPESAPFNYHNRAGAEFFIKFKRRFKNGKPKSSRTKPPTHSGLGELPIINRSCTNGAGFF